MTASTHRPRPADLTRLLEPVVAGQGYDLESVTISAAGRRSLVRLTVDSDDGVSLDAVADISRAVSEALDTDEALDRALPGAYVLEVSSPGVDRPLVAERHWRRSVGRLVAADLDGTAVTGRVVSVTDGVVSLDVDGSVRALELSRLGPGRVQVEFAHAASSKHDDSDTDADDEETADNDSADDGLENDTDDADHSDAIHEED